MEKIVITNWQLYILPKTNGQTLTNFEQSSNGNGNFFFVKKISEKYKW